MIRIEMTSIAAGPPSTAACQGLAIPRSRPAISNSWMSARDTAPAARPPTRMADPNDLMSPHRIALPAARSLAEPQNERDIERRGYCDNRGQQQRPAQAGDGGGHTAGGQDGEDVRKAKNEQRHRQEPRQHDAQLDHQRARVLGHLSFDGPGDGGRFVFTIFTAERVQTPQVLDQDPRRPANQHANERDQDPGYPSGRRRVADLGKLDDRARRQQQPGKERHENDLIEQGIPREDADHRPGVGAQESRARREVVAVLTQVADGTHRAGDRVGVTNRRQATLHVVDRIRTRSRT